MRRTIALITAVCALMIEAAAQVTWQRAYGGEGISEGRCIRETDDNGFIVVGSTGSFGNGASDSYLLKLNSLGERQWSKVFGGPSNDQGWAVRPLEDGGYILAGYTDAGTGHGFDGLVIRLDAGGEQVWQHTYGTEGWDFLYDVEVLPDGFVASGGTYRSGAAGEQAWVIRMNDEGTLLWERMLGDAEGTEARSIVRAEGDSLVIGGSWGLADGTRDVFVAKFDLDGNELWTTVVSEEGDNAGYSLVRQTDGNYVVGGFSTAANGRVMLLAKVASHGGLQWINHIEGGSGVWEGRSIREDYGGGLVLSGITTSYGNGAEDFYMARTDALGYWTSGPSFGTASSDQCWGMDLVSDGGYVMVGTTGGAEMNISSVYVVKNAGGIITDPLVEEFDPLEVPVIADLGPVVMVPNPAAPGSLVEIGPSSAFRRGWHAEIFDMQGATVATFNGLGRTSAQIRVPHVMAGAYVVRIIDANGNISSARLVVKPE